MLQGKGGDKRKGGRDGERERDRDRQTDRQTQRQTDRHRDRRTDRQIDRSKGKRQTEPFNGKLSYTYKTEEADMLTSGSLQWIFSAF